MSQSDGAPALAGYLLPTDAAIEKEVIRGAHIACPAECFEAGFELGRIVEDFYNLKLSPIIQLAHFPTTPARGRVVPRRSLRHAKSIYEKDFPACGQRVTDHTPETVKPRPGHVREPEAKEYVAEAF